MANEIDNLNTSQPDTAAIVNQFQADPNAVLSANNIAQTISNPVPRPDDLLGIRKYIGNELGIDQKQAAFDTVYQGLQQFDTATQELDRKIVEQPLGMNVIRGEQATASNLRASEREGLVRELEVAQSALQAAKAEQDTQFQIRQAEVQQKQQIMLQYPGAKIHAGDSFEAVAGKLEKYQKDLKKEAYKDALKQQLLAVGEKTSGNTKSLEKRLKKVNKSAYKRAQEEADLKLEALKMDIANTRSLISERGKGGSQTDLVPYYTFDATTGQVKQATDGSGQPVMVPKNAVISNMAKPEETIDLSGLETSNTDNSSVFGSVIDWVKSLWK